MDIAQSPLSFLQTRSLSSALEGLIEGLIFGGELTVGDRINEAQLAGRLGISRSPIREALRALEASGIVEVKPNRGVFVRRLDTDEALQVYGVRAALFGYAGQLLAETAGDVERNRLLSLQEAMTVAAEDHSFEAYFPLNFAFHDFIVEATGNTVLAAQYRALVKQLRLFRARNLMFGDTLAISNREHAAIVAAICAGDPAAAYRACYDHVECGRKRVMARAEQFGEAPPSPSVRDARMS